HRAKRTKANALFLVNRPTIDPITRSSLPRPANRPFAPRALGVLHRPVPRSALRHLAPPKPAALPESSFGNVTCERTSDLIGHQPRLGPAALRFRQWTPGVEPATRRHSRSVRRLPA